MNTTWWERNRELHKDRCRLYTKTRPPEDVDRIQKLIDYVRSHNV